MCTKVYGQQRQDDEPLPDLLDEEQDEHISPLEVGHNIYILAYKLSEHKKELKDKLENQAQSEASIKHYSEHTAQIEVRGLYRKEWK